MTEFNKDNMKQLKNKLIRLSWKTNGYDHSCVGKIKKFTKEALIFLMEGDSEIEDEYSEIPLIYSQIYEISQP